MPEDSALRLPPPRLKRPAKAEYKTRVETVRLRLLKAQQALREHDFPVLVVFGGVDGGGKHETVNLLNEWLDARYLRTLAYVEPSDEEAQRPRMWRYWRDLPVRGRMALVLSGWYSMPLVDYARHRSDDERFSQHIDEICSFERMIADDGGLILKFWMHLSAAQQTRRLRKLAEDPLTLWQIRPRDWEHLGLYQRFCKAAEQMIGQTDGPDTRWHLVDGSVEKIRHLQVAETIADALEARLSRASERASVRIKLSRDKRLKQADMTVSLDKGDYKSRLDAAQRQILRLQHIAIRSARSTVLVFEGWDAAGKGGAIRRLVRPLDARRYRIIPVAAPTDEEAARHYLWRFWRHLPPAGHLCIFDRSWYGRVLVERVEGFADEAQWVRAYNEINSFEKELSDGGIRVLKFWIHISAEEQLGRFRARESDPLKNWKLTDEDWRNFDKRKHYEQAIEDMLARTDTRHAPWVVVPGNDKRHARVTVLETVCQALQRY